MSKKFVFVCGLHRSGTTLLASEIARLDGCSGFYETRVLMDEGQFLQDVYPPDTKVGGVGEFGFSEASHRTEQSPLLTDDNIRRLRDCWRVHWDKDARVCIEKTPSNILATRFLQTCFPGSCFVVVKRHPVAVSLATQKWSRTPVHRLFDHWLRCHEIFEKDKWHLKHVHELSYEEYVSNPVGAMDNIAKFLGRPPVEANASQANGSYNEKYLARWRNMVSSSWLTPYYHRIIDTYEDRFLGYGYSLKEGLGFDLGEPKRRNKLVGEGVKFLANLGKPVARGSIKLEVAIRKWRTR